MLTPLEDHVSVDDKTGTDRQQNRKTELLLGEGISLFTFILVVNWNIQPVFKKCQSFLFLNYVTNQQVAYLKKKRRYFR